MFLTSPNKFHIPGAPWEINVDDPGGPFEPPNTEGLGRPYEPVDVEG